MISAHSPLKSVVCTKAVYDPCASPSALIPSATSGQTTAMVLTSVALNMCHPPGAVKLTARGGTKM
ncbi:MAG: hypothetical protein A3I61_18710 [Acidobacteria bacterium RIFCSPLOWO2_02_FULL_68_18]|nr:MAG: hypothetical protein A3I61_18710 [Acidobacteria bacterium RIFCSPLOWO2_02_FULL_68_18]